MTEVVADDRRHPREAGAFLKEHLGLIVSFAGALMVAVRIMSISGWNIETASIVLTTQSSTSILLGSAISLLLVIPVFLGVAVALFALRYAHTAKMRRRYAYAGLAVQVLGLVTLPWVYALVLLVSSALGVLIAMLLPRPSPASASGDATKDTHVLGEKTANWLLITSAALIGFGIVASVLLSSKPWLPAEAVIPQGGSGPYAGYVLSSDEAEGITLLTIKPRRVVKISGPAARHYCSDQSPSKWMRGSSVLQMASPGPTIEYPHCPDDEG